MRPVLVLAWKDIQLEMRSRDIVLSSLVFALLVMVVFNFGLDVSPTLVERLAPGVLWVAFTFAGVLAMSRAFIVEKDKGSLDGLLLCPVSRDALYFGKMLATLLFMLVVEALLLPVFAVLFNFGDISGSLIGIVLLATLGFATVGTLFSAIAVNTRSREIMLPLLFFPVVAPIVIGAVESSGAVLGVSDSTVGLGRWLQLIGIFDLIFLVICPWVFGSVLEE